MQGETVTFSGSSVYGPHGEEIKNVHACSDHFYLNGQSELLTTSHPASGGEHKSFPLAPSSSSAAAAAATRTTAAGAVSIE